MKFWRRLWLGSAEIRLAHEKATAELVKTILAEFHLRLSAMEQRLILAIKDEQKRNKGPDSRRLKRSA